MLHLIRRRTGRRTGGNGPGSPRRSGRSASARSVPTMLTTLLAVLLPLGLAQPALAAPSGRIVVTPPPVGPILTNEYHVESNRSIAWNGSTTVVTATDAFGNLDYWYQPGGATGWTEQVVASASSGTSYYDAEITASPTGVLITAVEYYTGSIDFWWEADGTTTWYQETVASGGQAGYFGNPSIAWSGAGVYIAATDKYGNAELWYAASGTATWTEQVVQRSYDGSYYEYASVAWDGYSSQPVVSADDRTSGNIYAWTPTSSGIWQTQQVQAALTPTDTLSHADITEVAGGMAITYTESVGNLQYLAEGTEASSWSGGTVASWFPDNDAYNDPSMAWTGDGEMIVANDAPTGDLDAWIGDGASGNAFQEQLIAPGPSDGGADYYGEASVAWTGTDEVVVASQTNTGHLAFWWHPTGSSAWYQEIIA